MSEMARWEPTIKDVFIDAFEKEFPLRQLEGQYHDRVKEGVNLIGKEAEVPKSRRESIGPLWDFCFENAYFPEGLKDLYDEITARAIRTFESAGYTAEEAIENIDGLKSECGERTMIGKVIKSYIDEIPEILITRLFNRYKDIINWDEGIYEMLIMIMENEKN